MMTSQLWLQHPVEPVVNDYAILLQLHICCEDTKNPPYLCDIEESFVIIYENASAMTTKRTSPLSFRPSAARGEIS